MNDLLLQALSSQNKKRPPIWIMRQAGRYLPSYQALRKKHSLYDLFFTPDLALEVTLLPVSEMNVDAAILFSDITVIVKAFGLTLDFQEGVGPVRIAIEPSLHRGKVACNRKRAAAKSNERDG